jgi:hypothetical protein
MSHTGDYVRQVVKPTKPQPAPAAAGVANPAASAPSGRVPAATAAQDGPRPADWHGTRRAQRFRVKSGVELQLDGTAAAVVDVSIVGAQVLSPTILRPNQKVRVSIAGEDAAIRFRGTIAWARFELPRLPASPRYRAGVEFIDADTAAVEDFCSRNRE